MARAKSKKRPAAKQPKPAAKKPAAKKSAKKPAAKKPAAKKSAAKTAAKKPAAKTAAKKPAAKTPAARPVVAKAAVAKPEPSGVKVGREELIAMLAKVAPRLAGDSIYTSESNAPFDAGELERYFETIGGTTTLEQLFSDTLQGMIQSVRYSALHVVRELFRDDKQALITTKPSITLKQGQSLAIVGDLIVEGDVQNDGILVVTGDLTIRGAYMGPAFDYSLVAVGGTMRARDVSTSGEILVGDRLEASRIVHLQYNDYSSILPALKTKALVVDDNFPALGSVDAEITLEDGHTADDLRGIFGAAAAVDAAIAAYDGNESPIRTLIRN